MTPKLDPMFHVLISLLCRCHVIHLLNSLGETACLFMLSTLGQISCLMSKNRPWDLHLCFPATWHLTACILWSTLQGRCNLSPFQSARKQPEIKAERFDKYHYMSSLMYHLCLSYRWEGKYCPAQAPELLQPVKTELPWCRLKVFPLLSLFTLWPRCVRALVWIWAVWLLMYAGWSCLIRWMWANTFCLIHLGRCTSFRALVFLFWQCRRGMRTGPHKGRGESERERESKLNTKRQEGRAQMSRRV